METGVINISRAAQKVVYPADFQLVCAMNPSPTGDIDDQRANPDQVLRYLNRISGPFLDRIDLQVNVPRIDLSKALKLKHRSGPSVNHSQASMHNIFQTQKPATNIDLKAPTNQTTANTARRDSAAQRELLTDPCSEQSRFSAPALSSPAPPKKMQSGQQIETSEVVKRRVIAAQERQLKRQGKLNKNLSGKEIEQYCPLSDTESLFLSKAMQSMNLSMRAYHRTMRVARTIADLECLERVNQRHLAEALSFRSFDRMLNELSE